jgi:multidrug resistance efflux pump
LASAQARLATAEANLAAAKAAFEDAELKTPISGTVADLKLKVGEQASPGQPAVTLAEFERWVVKTNNLTETDVVRVKVGQAAEVVLDALPEVALKGTVTAISPVFVESRGDVTYTVTIELIDADPSMRWGMTAQVTLAP